MRNERTTDEARILERLTEPFEKFKIQNPIISTEIIDRPDIVLSHDGGRLGIEICRLDFESYCKWLKQTPAAPYSRAGEVTVNLEKMLANVMRIKRGKYNHYDLPPKNRLPRVT